MKMILRPALRTLLIAMLGACAGSVAEAATVTLTWTAPTTRIDGVPLTGALTTQIWDAVGGVPAVQIGTGSSPFTTPTLGIGAHSFHVVVCEAGGGCSAPSNTVAEMIVPAPPNAVTDLSAVVNP